MEMHACNKGKEPLPTPNRLTQYLLDRYKHRLLGMPFTPERSRVVACIDCILETEREGRHA